MRTPTESQQASFVSRLQRLLVESEFSNTYKFALLLSLTRWAVENPDYDERLALDVKALAPHFTELYWPHVRPYSTPAAKVAAPTGMYGNDIPWSRMLLQDQGEKSERQAPRMLKEIWKAQTSGIHQFDRLPAKTKATLLTAARKKIVEMPLWRLHNVRDSEVPIRFLYRPAEQRSQVLFEDGIVACLVHFAPLVEEIVRAAWLRFVVRCNKGLLGASADLEAFLFPESRTNLEPLRQPLLDLQGGRCFYCGSRLTGGTQVDHFLPWSRYPRDLTHNFVLADDKCNLAKCDHLPDCDHLEKWCSRNDALGEEIDRQFAWLRMPADWPTLKRVAGSLYQLAEAGGSRLWVRKKEFVAVAPRWRRILEGA